MGKFVIREYKMESPKIKKDFTAILVADLHNCTYGEDNQKLIDAIIKIQPDVVFCAGDMLTARKGIPYDTALSFVKRVGKQFPLYYGLGNHEYRMKIYPEDYGDFYYKYLKEIQKVGVHVLDNQYVFNEEFGFKVSGLSIQREYYKRFRKINMPQSYIEKEIGKADSDYFQVLIAHNPEYYETYDKWGADLVLSGHIHGGVMRLPILGGVISPKLVLFPKYDGGEFCGKNGKMILSRGLGVHTIPIRIFNPAELVVLRLAKKGNSL